MKSLLDLYGLGQAMPYQGDGQTVSTADFLPAYERENQYQNSMFGKVANWLEGKKKGLEDASMFNPVTMGLDGLGTMNRWMGASQYPEKLEPVDVLAPLGLSAMAAPFMPRLGSSTARAALPMSDEQIARSFVERLGPEDQKFAYLSPANATYGKSSYDEFSRNAPAVRVISEDTFANLDGMRSASNPSVAMTDHFMGHKRYSDAMLDGQLKRVPDTESVAPLVGEPINDGGNALSAYDKKALDQAWRRKVAKTGELFSDTTRSSLPGTVVNALDMSHEARMQRAREMGIGDWIKNIDPQIVDVVLREQARRLEMEKGLAPEMPTTYARLSPGPTHLPMDDAARLARAKEMGFDVDNPVYHGSSTTATPFDEFDPALYGNRDSFAGAGVYTTRDENFARAASANSDNRPLDGTQGYGHYRKMYARASKPFEFNMENVRKVFPENEGNGGITGAQQVAFSDRLRSLGYDVISVPGPGREPDLVYLYPNQLRDVNAAFDPAMSRSANLLAADQARASLPGTVVNALEDGQRGAFGNGFAPLENLPAFNYELPGGVRVSRYNNNYEFFDGDNKIGNAYVRDLGDRVQVGKIGLDEPYQRRGIGNAFYDQLGDEYRKTVVPDDTLSPAAYEFWKKRDPDAVAGHVLRGNNYYRGFEELGPEPAALPARTERNANLLDQLKALDELLSRFGSGP